MIDRPAARARTAGAVLAALVLGLGLAGPAMGQGVSKVPARPVGPDGQSEWRDWVPDRARRDICVPAGRIGGAIVLDARTIDVLLRGGSRWRLFLERDCREVTFYGGFYYAQAETGQICAGADRIIGRAGGECAIRAISRLRRAR